jgi:hypothetical protein
MKIADFMEATMEWTVTIEGRDEYGEIQRAQVQIEKGLKGLRLAKLVFRSTTARGSCPRSRSSS